MKFLSNELVEVSAQADPIINSHLDRLDRVSNDIKVLENKLQKAAIPFTVVYVLFSKKSFSTVKYEKSSCYHIYNYEDHCLVWSQTKHNGTRLFYNIYLTEREYKLEDGGEESEKLFYKPKLSLISTKPLIEMKALVRLHIEKELPYFYKKLIERLKTDKKEFCFICSSSNYKKNSQKDAIDPLKGESLILQYKELPVEKDIVLDEQISIKSDFEEIIL